MKKLMMGVLAATISANCFGFSINIGTGSCTGDLNTTNPVTNQTFCADLDDALNDEIDSNLPAEGDISLGDYGTGVANANAFSQKGLGSDYSDDFDLVMVKVSGNAAIEGDLDQIMDDPTTADGFSIGAAATVGINMDVLPISKVGPIEMDKLDLFVSFMSYNYNGEFSETDIEGNISSFGVMARYHLIDSVDIVPGNMLQWGGVYVHTGIQRSSFSLELSRSLNGDTVTVDGPSGTDMEATIGNTSADIELTSTALTIPIEVSTYVRTAWAFTFFGGAGFDIVTADTTVDFDLNSTSVSGTAQSPASGSYSNTVEGSGSGDGEADATNLRAFVGFQINAPFVRLLNVQINKGLGNDLLGVNIGAKVLF